MHVLSEIGRKKEEENSGESQVNLSLRGGRNRD